MFRALPTETGGLTMKNATVAIATTFALVTAAMAVEIGRRHASVADVVRASDALNASAVETPGAADAAIAATAAAQNTAPENARPVALSPLAAAPVAPAPVAEHRSEAEIAPPAPLPAASQPIPAKTPPVASVDAGDAPAEAKSAVVKSAVVKPQIIKPAARKPVMEKAGAGEPAPVPSTARAADKPHVARAHGFPRDAEQSAREPAPAHPVRYARWSGGEGARLRPGPDAYGFSGSFGGCQYRGVVSVTGYRIEKSC
jgi:hypothetical protein